MGLQLLAFDTATPACTVALCTKNGVYFRHEHTPQAHNQKLLDMIQCLLKESGLQLNQLDGVAFGKGPGSFTGVRIATSVAQGLALGAGLSVIPVSTLQVLAQTAYQKIDDCQHILVGWDARMGEVYWGQYALNPHESVMLPLIKDGLYAPHNVVLAKKQEDLSVNAPHLMITQKTWKLVGSAWKIHKIPLINRCQTYNVSIDKANIMADEYPHATALLNLASYYFQLGHRYQPALARPNYLRQAIP